MKYLGLIWKSMQKMFQNDQNMSVKQIVNKRKTESWRFGKYDLRSAFVCSTLDFLTSSVCKSHSLVSFHLDKMSATVSSRFSARTKATERVSRYRSDLDRTPSYGLGDVSTSATFRIPITRSRESSLTSTYRRDSFTRGTSPLTTPIRIKRDSSLSVTANSPSMNRRSVVLASGLGSETAKYNREVALKEISKNFNDEFRQNQMKYHHIDPNDAEADRMNKARSKILGQSAGPTAYLDDHFERRAAVR